jgi:thioredoxin 1
MGKKITVLSSESFDEFISKGNVVVDFYADWCGPCKMMAPHFEKASEKVTGVKFAKIDIDDNLDVASKFQVMSIPTTILFKDGEMVDRRTGAMYEEDIEKIIESNFN